MSDLQSALAQAIAILRCLNLQLLYGVFDVEGLKDNLAEARKLVIFMEQELRRMAEQS